MRRGLPLSEKFQLFRISLLLKSQKDAFEIEDASRENFLRRVFGTEFRFGHYGNAFFYEPVPDQADSQFLFGRLGRRRVVDENLPPDQHLEETSRESWKACIIVVDPTEHADGQKAAIEIEKEIGGPTALMSALAREINTQNVFSAYSLQVNPIFDASSFWQFADENYGRVTSLTFDFVAPNGLWSANTSLREELVELRKELKTHQVSTTFKSPEGLETNSERIEEAVEYAEKGSGRIRARAKGNRHFNSTEKPKIVTLEDDKAPRQGAIAKVKANLRRILGRE